MRFSPGCSCCGNIPENDCEVCDPLPITLYATPVWQSGPAGSDAWDGVTVPVVWTGNTAVVEWSGQNTTGTCLGNGGFRVRLICAPVTGPLGVSLEALASPSPGCSSNTTVTLDCDTFEGTSGNLTFNSIACVGSGQTCFTDGVITSVVYKVMFSGAP